MSQWYVFGTLNCDVENKSSVYHERKKLWIFLRYICIVCCIYPVILYTKYIRYYRL